jgi:hypothetical protein
MLKRYKADTRHQIADRDSGQRVADSGQQTEDSRQQVADLRHQISGSRQEIPGIADSRQQTVDPDRQ